ncbi:MAG: hypothetical protein LAQ30_30530, partial [Acidobacteriia bacterium]|nr:hypothetical protein [Terriglobia bacterium]
MNFELIGHLIGLRYKLLWAKTRSRNGKIALFMTGYLLLVGVIFGKHKLRETLDCTGARILGCPKNGAFHLDFGFGQLRCIECRVLD